MRLNWHWSEVIHSTQAEVTLGLICSVSVQDMCLFCFTPSDNMMPEAFSTVAAFLSHTTLTTHQSLHWVFFCKDGRSCPLQNIHVDPLLKKGRLHSSNRYSLRHNPPYIYIPFLRLVFVQLIEKKNWRVEAFLSTFLAHCASGLEGWMEDLDR